MTPTASTMAAEILADLQRRDVTLIGDEERPRVRAPKGVLTAEDQAAIQAHKDELLALVSPSSAIVTADPAPPPAKALSVLARSSSGQRIDHRATVAKTRPMTRSRGRSSRCCARAGCS